LSVGADLLGDIIADLMGLTDSTANLLGNGLTNVLLVSRALTLGDLLG